jgi:hypothetical protein
MNVSPIRNIWAAAVLLMLQIVTGSAQTEQPSPGVLAVLLNEEAAHAHRLNQEERVKAENFLKEQMMHLQELSSSEMEAEAKILAQQIDKGVSENRLVWVKVVDGEEHLVLKPARVDGYWFTLRCAGPKSRTIDKTNEYYADKPDTYDIRVRSTSILSVSVGQKRVD